MPWKRNNVETVWSNKKLNFSNRQKLTKDCKAQVPTCLYGPTTLNINLCAKYTLNYILYHFI